jgi:hypothetical protein
MKGHSNTRASYMKTVTPSYTSDTSAVSGPLKLLARETNPLSMGRRLKSCDMDLRHTSRIYAGIYSEIY